MPLEKSSAGCPPPHIAIIGAGPAGLKAAESAAVRGAKVTIYDAKSGPGRKFLIAGKSGLNLTFDENMETLLKRYSGENLPRQLWNSILTEFDNQAIRSWSHNLGINTFTAPSGKVFPEPLRAAPLLRRWLSRLAELGVKLVPKHKLINLRPRNGVYDLTLETPAGEITQSHDAVVLALGGASWPKSGSDANWLNMLEQHNVSYTPFSPANCGWEVAWPPALLEEAEGLPLKNITVRSGSQETTGELMITKYGLEGSAIYRLGSAIRKLTKPNIVIDFKPTHSHSQLVAKLGNTKRGFVREARHQWKLSKAAAAVLKHLPDRGPWKDATTIAREVKHCEINLIRPRPLAEAISSQGGVSWDELDSNLMLKRLPGIFLCGEMIDWEAPTGGYLLQACFATGHWAGRAAAEL